jgi:hypothetical protein
VSGVVPRGDAPGAVGEHQLVEGGVVDRHLVRCRERDGVDAPVDRREDATVGDDDDAPSGVLHGEVIESAADALVEGAPALAAGNGEVRVGFVLAREGIRVTRAGLVVGESLAQPEAALAQP